VVDRFKHFAEHEHLFPDAQTYAGLIAAGSEALKADSMDKLRIIVLELDELRIGPIDESALVSGANIVRS
jgi:molecular chaperone DnaK